MTAGTWQLVGITAGRSSCDHCGRTLARLFRIVSGHCFRPATCAVEVEVSCGCGGHVYSCGGHRPFGGPGFCNRRHQYRVRWSAGPARPLNEGDLPDDPTDRITGWDRETGFIRVERA